MDDHPSSSILLDQTSSIPTSATNQKAVAEKRRSDELDDNHDVSPKRVKLRDLDSVFQSEAINPHHSKSSKIKEAIGQSQSDGEDLSQVTEVPTTLDLDASQVERSRTKKSTVVPDALPIPLDLNSKLCANTSSCDASPKCADNAYKPSSLLDMHNRETNNNCVPSFCIGLDLNTEDVASSVNQDPFYLYKNHTHFKARDASECGSSTGPLEEKDSMRVWKEMKQNGFLSSSHGGISVQSSFLSSSHGGIPPMPKQRGRKSKNDTYKKKMELAKRENVDRFTKIAAPSGLLNDLNPGIINNVRNRKQVYSIIEAIVRSEKHENCHSGSRQSSYLKSGTKDVGHSKDPEYTNDSGIRLSHLPEVRPPNPLCVGLQPSEYAMPMHNSYPPISEEKSADGDSSLVDYEDDALALKLSSSNKASENATTLSNDESTNFPSAASLSVKAATVASQWLELLNQDIKGRLSALRRSKKRVRAVITTELPFLVSKEFSSGEENDPNVIKSLSNNATVNMHQQRWNMLFDQMDKALTEEEKQLENWLNQVKEMQLHCDQGLQYIHWNTSYVFQQLGTSENDFRSGKTVNSEKDLAVKAAAASIYSTCNFLSSKENVSCC